MREPAPQRGAPDTKNAPENRDSGRIAAVEAQLKETQAQLKETQAKLAETQARLAQQREELLRAREDTEKARKQLQSAARVETQLKEAQARLERQREEIAEMAGAGEEARKPAQPEPALEAQLKEAQARSEQQREEMIRALAETENVRKRAQAEAAAAQKFALERFAGTLLPVLDSLDAALKAENASVEALRSGAELTLKQLKGALERASITEVNPAKGERFDPHRHQAMAAVEADTEPNTVVSVMQKGYLLHDRVLRPALVTVARQKVEKPAANPISDTSSDSGI